MRRACLLLLLAIALPAAAQLRTIPKEASYGQIRHLQAMVVELNGKQAQLSPGAQIRDADNRLVLPSSLTEKSVVRFLVDGAGLVHRVWILSPQERAQIPQQAVTLPAEK